MVPNAPRIALVVATCDRPREVGRMLASVSAQIEPPDRVIIVDSGTRSLKDVTAGPPGVDVVHLESPVRSASRQRNMGVAAAGPGFDLIGFADDDVTFEPDAFQAMRAFWRRAPGDLGGAGFNLLNHPPLALRVLKFLPLTRLLQLYDQEPGRVLRSGIQTLIGTVPRNKDVEWLPTTAVIWKQEIFASFGFDEWFQGYSYLEDLDFSYRVAKRFKLAVVADAGYRHFPAPNGRGSGAEFGKREVLNRMHFVGKNAELSRLCCYQALVFRMLISFGNAAARGSANDLSRVWGNMLGLWESLRP